MALSGSFTGSTSNKYIQPKIVWSATQSVDGNYSDVTATLYYSRTNSGYTTAGTWSGGITINGTRTAASKSISITQNSNTQAVTATTRVYHNADGTKSINISGDGAISVASLTYTTCSSTVTLNTIPRASSVSATNANIGSSTTITISRASSSFTHTLRYSCWSLTGTIATKTSSTSVVWTLPTSFYAQMPNSKQSWGTIYCDTYSGSTLVGTKSCTFNIYVDENTNKPTLNPTIVDQGSVSTTLTGDTSKIIKYYNTCNVVFNASAKNSATISSMKVTCGSKSRASDGLLEYVDSGTFVFTATDSRGFTTTQTITKDTIDYVPLTCNLSTNYNLIDGSTVNVNLAVKGKYFSGSFGAVTNSLAVEYRCKTNDGDYPTDDEGNEEWTPLTNPTVINGEYTAQATITGLDYSNFYTFQARAKDSIYTNGITSAGQTIVIKPVFDWSKKDFNFNVPVHGAGGFTYDIPVDNYNVNTMLTSGMYYLGSTSTNRPIAKNGWLEVNSYDSGNYCYQKFIAYSGEKYERWRNAGVWGDWITNGQSILWSGAWHMNENQTASLSSPISKQANGIQLIFSPYQTDTGVASDWDFNAHIMPKKFMETWSGDHATMTFTLGSSCFYTAATKILNIYDNAILGSASNTATGTSQYSGIMYENSGWVLRYVIGF